MPARSTQGGPLFVDSWRVYVMTGAECIARAAFDPRLGAGGSRVLAMVAGWETSVSGGSIALAFGVAMAIGVFFGLYPAHKASRLDPIEALRHE